MEGVAIRSDHAREERANHKSLAPIKRKILLQYDFLSSFPVTRRPTESSPSFPFSRAFLDGFSSSAILHELHAPSGFQEAKRMG